MSTVEDLRKLLQDFLAPELRAISVRLDAVEAHLSQQDVRFSQLDTQRQRDHDALDARLSRMDTQRQHDKEDILRAIQTLYDYSSLAERLARVESKISQPH